MAESELKPCPFCGTSASLDGALGRHWLECNSATCWSSGPMRDTEAEAIAAWNRRSDDALAAAEATIATLTAEHDARYAAWDSECRERTKRIAALQARIAALEEALAPFAAYGRLTRSRAPGVVVGVRGADGIAAVTKEDFARAAVLTPSQGGDPCPTCKGTEEVRVHRRIERTWEWSMERCPTCQGGDHG